MSLLANFLTLLRIAVIPYIIWGFFMSDKIFGAVLVLMLFIAASLTDYLDGMIARRFNATSKFGQMLDPIADKMLVIAVLIMLVYDRQANGLPRADLVPVIIIILREIIVSGLREFLALQNIPMPVTTLAKWKTACQFFAVLVLLGAPLTNGIVIGTAYLPLQNCGQILLWLAAALSFITGWQYFRHSLKETFRDNKIFAVKLVKAEEAKKQ